MVVIKLIDPVFILLNVHIELPFSLILLILDSSLIALSFFLVEALQVIELLLRLLVQFGHLLL